MAERTLRYDERAGRYTDADERQLAAELAQCAERRSAVAEHTMAERLAMELRFMEGGHGKFTVQEAWDRCGDVLREYYREDARHIIALLDRYRRPRIQIDIQPLPAPPTFAAGAQIGYARGLHDGRAGR